MKHLLNYALIAITFAIFSTSISSCGNDEDITPKLSIPKTINLVPLMTIAGDHSHNDMAGVAEEGDSWREQLVKAGYKCDIKENCYQVGLGDFEDIQEIWIKHLRDAIKTIDSPKSAKSTSTKQYSSPDTRLKFAKTSNTAVLLVTFGSTMEGPHSTYAKEVAAFRKAFPGTDVFMAFTSPQCISRWFTKKNEYYGQPYEYFEAFKTLGYENVYVQSLHATKGVEFNGGKNSEGTLHGLKNYYDLFVGQNPSVKTCLGLPLLSSIEDIKAVGDFIYNEYKAEILNGASLVLMGHGNEEDADSSMSTANTYLEVEKYLQSKNSDIYVGTVDCPTVSFDRVLEELNKKYGVAKKK